MRPNSRSSFKMVFKGKPNAQPLAGNLLYFTHTENKKSFILMGLHHGLACFFPLSSFCTQLVGIPVFARTRPGCLISCIFETLTAERFHVCAHVKRVAPRGLDAFAPNSFIFSEMCCAQHTHTHTHTRARNVQDTPQPAS